MSNEKAKPKKKKLEIKERPAGKATENFMANVTPLRSPIADIFDFPVSGEAISVISTENNSSETELNKAGTPPTLPTPATTPSQGQIKTKGHSPVAPINNFQKVTNTITRDAIPQGLFKAGKSKQVYDVLYGLTRGAITPTRVVKISKPKLRSLSGVGARTTMDACINHLQFVGLIEQRINDGGSHEGNEYEVFTPEELTLSTVSTTSRQGRQANPARQSEHGNQGHDALKQDGVGSLDLRHAEQGQNLVTTGTSEIPNTSFKDINKNDDEAFAKFTKKFQELANEITGKKFTRRENENFGKLADLLILEFKIAARRTDNISSIPAFLTEVIRRRLREMPAPLTATKSKPDKVGKSEPTVYEIKSLDEKEREAAIVQLQEFAEDEFLHDFKKWYTEEDWNWLLDQMKILKQ